MATSASPTPPPAACVRNGRPAPALIPSLRRAAEHGSDEIPVLPIDGRVYGVQARRVPAEHAVLLVVRDRTEELKREQAEREFVSNAAHELRNPLAGIMSGDRGAAERARRTTPRPATASSPGSRIDAERMTRLTQSLLTLARVEAAGERDPAQVVDVVARGRGGRPRRSSPRGRRAPRRGRARPRRGRRSGPAPPGDDRAAHQRLRAHSRAGHGYASRGSRGGRRQRDDRGRGHRKGNPRRRAGSRLRALLPGLRRRSRARASASGSRSPSGWST